MKLRRYMFAASAVGLAVGALSPAYAQSQTKQEPVAAEEEQEESSTVENTSEAAAAEEGTILVTGSRIRRDTFSSIEPITLTNFTSRLVRTPSPFPITSSVSGKMPNQPCQFLLPESPSRYLLKF